MERDENILILPGSQLYLRVIHPGDPLMHQVAGLYVRSFEDWGQALISTEGHNLALEYLMDYCNTHSGTVIALILQNQVLGGAVLSYGSKQTVAQNVLGSIAASYDDVTESDSQPLWAPAHGLLHDRLLAGRGNSYVEISDLFLEKRDVIYPLIVQILPQIYTDMATLNRQQMPDSPTSDALFTLVNSFRQSLRIPRPAAGRRSRRTPHLSLKRVPLQRQTRIRRRPTPGALHQKPHRSNGRSPVHDIYRLFSLSLLLGSLTHIQHISGFLPGTTTCVQWTCVGTPMYRLFQMLCHPRSTRIATIMDGTVPFIGRVASHLPGDPQFINNLIDLGKNSEMVWEGPIGNGTRPQNGKADYNRIMVTKFPLDGLIMLIYNWNTYSFFVRRHYLGVGLRYSRHRLRHRASAR